MTTITTEFDTVTEIPHEDLGDVLAEIFPKHFLAIETGMFNALASMCYGYAGGLWTGYTNPDRSVFFMVPPGDDYHLVVQGNYFEGTVDAETAGIITSLMVLNALVWQTYDPAHSTLFYNLRTFALDHPQCTTIMAAID